MSSIAARIRPGGRRVCGDTLPEQCRGRAYRFSTRRATSSKEVGRTADPEQKAELILENKRRKQPEDAGREQRRRDQALLDTYTTAEDIDWPAKRPRPTSIWPFQATNERIATAPEKAQEVRRRGRVLQEKCLAARVGKKTCAPSTTKFDSSRN